MATTTENHIHAVFTDSDGAEVAQNIADFKDGITDEEIATGLTAIVTNNIFETDSGATLASVKSAQKVVTTTTDVDLTETDD